ncbi:DPP IV N-terminal domain-containing protein [Brevundimonas nasdae]|uniref:DPP IV N-terminal domain-containing protein n=1 Tax=Brevundimonas nasdae TaxID=172043 RepID=A0ACD4VHH1_9CAUL|nr:DPP IV N-terminal domain-containing protein [Brevundimonas nasdae]WOB77395.1 DPP IV N-terminal domain-containing protein [Brevundimonas nasdae]
MRTLLLASTILLSATSALAQETPSNILTPERVFSSPSLNGPVAKGVSLSPDGQLVAFLRSREDNVDVQDLWAAPTGEGEPYKLIDARALVPDAGELSEAEKARRERMRISARGVVEYSWDQQGRYILAPLEGDIFLANRADGKVRRLTETPADEIDAKVSPKGSYVSYVRDQNLVVYDLASGKETPISDDGAGLITWATAEFIAQEEMDRDTGYWWSPDERYIAMTRVDESPVDIVPRFEITGGGATMVEQRYPRAGRPNAVVELYVRDLQGGGRVKVDLGSNTDIYLARVNWSGDGKTLYVQRQSRDQKTLDLLSVDPTTGASRVILSQKAQAWVDLNDDFRVLSDGRFIWSNEDSGWRHLYLYDRNGRRLRAITRGDYPVKHLDGVNEQTGDVYFTASMRDGKELPIEQQMFRANLNRTVDPVAVTPGGGWWTVSVNGPATAYVGNYSDPATPTQSALYRIDGTRVRWIEENKLDASHPFAPYVSRLRTPEFGTMQSHGQTLVWRMTTPPDFDPSKKYPVVMQVYGGPGTGAGVQKSWQPLTNQLLTEAGYIVFRVDNRGEGDRSQAFETSIYRRLGIPAVEDQAQAAQWLKTLPYVDADHIAVMGWSFGGFLSLLTLTDKDAGLASALAGAAPTEWSLYDTHYTERYMSTPQANPEGYAATDVLPRLDDMTGRLLLLHGMADDNVIFGNATRVIDALQAKSVPFEMMLYPGQRHGVRGDPRQLQQWRTYLDFLDRTIGKRAEPKAD